MTPTLRWAPLTISQLHITGGFIITLTTDIPCHLYLYWTDKIPWLHRVGKIQRGLAIPWDQYWCYVAWTAINQQEPGDTLIHTYIWKGWQECNTRYFRFRGTIAGTDSPSDSPIFHKHYVPPPTPPEVNIPPYLPYQVAGNRYWHAQPFTAPESAPPNTLYIWLWVYGAAPGNVEVFVEDVDFYAAHYYPYADQAGHKKGEYTIPNAELMLHIGQYYEYTCPLVNTSLLTKDQHYAVTCNSGGGLGSFRFVVRGEDNIDDAFRMTFSNTLGYAARSWQIAPTPNRQIALRLTF